MAGVSKQARAKLAELVKQVSPSHEQGFAGGAVSDLDAIVYVLHGALAPQDVPAAEIASGE